VAGIFEGLELGQVFDVGDLGALQGLDKVFRPFFRWDVVWFFEGAIRSEALASTSFL